MTWGEAYRIAGDGYRAWAAKAHNKRWVAKIDHTPIPNDLIANIADAFAADPRPTGEDAELVAEVERRRRQLHVNDLPADVKAWSNFALADRLATALSARSVELEAAREALTKIKDMHPRYDNLSDARGVDRAFLSKDAPK